MLYLGITLFVLMIFFIYFVNKRSCEKYMRRLLDSTEMTMIIVSICLGAYSISVSNYFSTLNIKIYFLSVVIIMLGLGVVLKGFVETDLLTGITILVVTIILVPLGSFIIVNAAVFANAAALLFIVYIILKSVFKF